LRTTHKPDPGPSSAAAPRSLLPETLSDLGQAEAHCRRCSLYRAASQVVPGAGDDDTAVMLVGEQPGDREDIVGKPFVGPAGRVLDAALNAAGLTREKIFVTNAVKHFKHEQRGKRRLHKRPNASEIERCRWWLDLERRLVEPRVIVAMGGTAVRSLLGRSPSISALRGKPQTLADGTTVVVTIHPSFLLRIKEEAPKQREFRKFVADLRNAAASAGAS
jgi:uracil-DNA glycosylase